MKKSPKNVPTSSAHSNEPLPPTMDSGSSPGYTPPPPPESPASSPEIETPTLPPVETEESPSSGKSKRTYKKRGQPLEVVDTTSPRPPAHPVLGGKGLECFVWSGAHDDDAEFLRRYGARVNFMCQFHADQPEAQAAIERLQNLSQ